jgi:hypothetical protein
MTVTLSARIGEMICGGRVEGWRAHGRVRWQFHGFRRGPQSGSPGHVSSPRHVGRVEGWRGVPQEPVSSPRHVEPGRRFSRTRLSCPLRAQAYETYRRGSAFGGNQPAYST